MESSTLSSGPRLAPDPAEGAAAAERPRLGDYLRAWRLLAGFVALGGAVGLVAALLLPAWYESTTVLAVVPVDDPTTPGVTSSVEGAGAELPMLAAVLRSRRVADDVIAQLGLERVYRVGSTEVARRELARHVSVTAERKANLVTIKGEGRTPEAAQALVQAISDAGTVLHARLWVGRTRAHRARLEARLAEVSSVLAAAEDALRRFRDENHVVDLAEQVKASLAEAVALERLRIDKRLRLHFARGFGSERADEVAQVRREVMGATRAVHEATAGRPRPGPLLPLSELPRLEQEYARLKRAVDASAASHDQLTRQIEQLRTVESRPSGHADVIDRPSLARERSRPHRTALVAEGAIVGLLLGVGLVTAGAMRRRKDAW